MHTYANYDEAPDPSHRPMYLEKTLRHLDKLGSGRRVLDAGCGGGDFAEGLAAAGYTVCGLDLNTSAVEAAQQRDVGTFVVSSMYENMLLPFGEEAFDAVVAIETIEHLYSPRTFAKRVAEALRPGGLFIVTTPYWGYLKNIALAVTNRTDKALTALWEGGHIKHFSRKTLTELMTDEGFSEVAFHGCGEGLRGYTPYLWNGMLMVFRKP